MRGIIAIVLACLLSVSAPLTTAVSAADLGMPMYTKAPPPPEEVTPEFNYVPVIAAVIVGAVLEQTKRPRRGLSRGLHAKIWRNPSNYNAGTQHPQKRTSVERIGMSALCHKRTLPPLAQGPLHLSVRCHENQLKIVISSNTRADSEKPTVAVHGEHRRCRQKLL